MKNNNNNSSKAMQELLKAASKQLGTTPDALKSQFSQGNYQSAMSSMSKEDAAKLQAALSDKQMCQRVLNSPQAQAIYKKLSGGK